MNHPPVARRMVVATFNPDKRRELAALLPLAGVEWIGLEAFEGAAAPAEDGDSLEANARIKAAEAVRRTGLPAVADDTGFEVDALGGAPGVHAARYAGPGARDADNVRKLLAALAGVAPAQRTARFRTVCLVRFPDGVELIAEGTLEGVVIDAPRGLGGFGYDPVFVPRGESRTLAEMDLTEKNAISHRARAAREIRARLETYFTHGR